MAKVKTPSVAGMFYPADKEELKNLIESFKTKETSTPTRAVIVPHAGLIYSGKLAYKGIFQLSKEIKTIFIIAPAHRQYFDGIATISHDIYQTPLGEIEINRDIIAELEKENLIQVYDEGFADEHSAEIQIPLIQSIFENVKIVPLLVCDADYKGVSKIIEKYYPDKNNGFVISSDLSHFLDDNTARKIDEMTASIIENGNYSNLRSENACGYIGIQGLSDFASKNNFSLIRLGMYNSSTTTKDKARVVGYGSWLLYEGAKNQYIKENYSNTLIELSRAVLKTAFSPENIRLSYPQVLNEEGACFVTLEKQGALRGCIGSIIAHRTLLKDLIENTKNAAFSDPRFTPLKEEELNEIDISISILSAPKEIDFENEEDLLEKIVPFKDGIIIRDGNYQAVYLPSVWEQIPEKDIFLNSLKMKAGLSPDYFSDNFKAYRFNTAYIKEKN